MLEKCFGDKEPPIRDGTRGKQKQIRHPIGISISRTGILSERATERRFLGWMVRQISQFSSVGKGRQRRKSNW
jgi:hypothetical protein